MESAALCQDAKMQPQTPACRPAHRVHTADSPQGARCRLIVKARPIV